MKNYEVEIKGITPLMHHRMPHEALIGLLGAKSKKKKDKIEQTPREIADKHVYKTEDGKFYIPMEFVVGAFKGASSDYKQSNSSKKSYKTIAAGIFRPLEETSTLIDHDDKPLKDFEVDLRKGNNHQAGAVCICRPRFDKWKAKFNIGIDTDLISEETAIQILEDAGRRYGIGSFRVAKGGYFGQFSVTKFQKLTSD